ncbi:MAG: DEAD/DEAH box helicase [Treponema sp.]|jgi:ATP-dependent RNA helicase RhlB|nr:DEAD/DEAH box helicase [Treponema sp.]
MEFSELNLNSDLARGIAEAGYVTCMPVQEQVLGHAFGGQDLYVQSQTGTGKTAAFLIVIFERLLTEPNLAGKKALIIAPTRELAVQIEEEARMLAKYLPFKIGSFYGGVGYGDQQRLLRDNVQILVGTPGRVLDLNGSGQMNLMDIAFLVLDEADRMFDMGFYPDLRKLIRVVPSVDRRQTMLFSATLNAWVKNLAWEYTKSPYEIEIEPETVTVEEIEQYLYHVTSENKMKVLLGILRKEQPESAIVFCNTKRYAEIVAKRLRINGYECEYIMGDLPQSRRLRIIEDLKAGKNRFLVATDVAARGLDIEGLAMVINYDLPVESENYVHRIGRTARAGKTGKAVTLASEQDVYELPAIERFIGKKIPSQIADEGLYAEDKSEGMRIRTEFAGGRDAYDGGSRRDRRGGFGTDRGEKRGDRPGKPRARERPAEAKSGGRKRGPDEGRKRDEHRTGRPAPSRAGDRQGGEDLSRLSFDERMAHYRKKYSSAGKPPETAVNGGAGAAAGGAASRGGDARRRRGGEGRRPGTPAAGNGRGQVRRQGQREDGRQDRKRRDRGPDRIAAGNAGNNAARQNAGTGAQKGGGQKEAAAPKKGILNRIMGLFRKKAD